MESKTFIAGSCSGVITKTLIAPFDRIKILYQVNNPLIIKNKPLIYNIKNIYYKEGFLSFYKGNISNILKHVPTYSLKFTFNDFYKQKLYNNNLNFNQSIFCGLLTGYSLITITYPLDLLRTNIAIKDNNISFIKRTCLNEGLKGFYKGYGLSVLTGSMHISLQMSSYDYYKKILLYYECNNNVKNLFAGSCAGVTAATLTYPGDVVRKNMHIENINTFNCFNKIINKYGYKSLFNGLKISIIKTIPNAAIQFATFDFIKNFLYKNNI